MNRYEGKTAIITGATKGIGLAAAQRLSSEGASLVLVARSEEDGNALVKDLGEQRTVFVCADVSDPKTASLAVDVAHKQFRALDVLVNNAGIDHNGPLLTTPESEVRQVFDVNFFGALFMLQAAAAAMRGFGGAIVNVTSRLASIGVPLTGPYSASKGALLAITRTAAIEWASEGIRVNAVAPGFTLTPLAKTWFATQESPIEAEARAASQIPQKRLATPEEVASAIAFLGSDEAAHITGASLAVDGGYTAA